MEQRIPKEELEANIATPQEHCWHITPTMAVPFMHHMRLSYSLAHLAQLTRRVRMVLCCRSCQKLSDIMLSRITASMPACVLHNIF